MEFGSRSQEEVFAKVVRWMREIFGECAIVSRKVPAVHFHRGSAVVIVSVYPWGDNESVVEIESELVKDMERSPDLFEFLLTENHRMRFGGFSLDRRGKVTFRHTLVGSTCGKNELEASVHAVSAIADEYDGKIVSSWGGVMATEE